MQQRLSGLHINIDFSGQNLAGVTLDGKFVDCSFERVNITGAVLCGQFVRCTFYGAQKDHVDVRDGIFVDCIGLEE